jgi:hypothetical protein
VKIFCMRQVQAAGASGRRRLQAGVGGSGERRGTTSSNLPFLPTCCHPQEALELEDQFFRTEQPWRSMRKDAQAMCGIPGLVQHAGEQLTALMQQNVLAMKKSVRAHHPPSIACHPWPPQLHALYNHCPPTPRLPTHSPLGCPPSRGAHALQATHMLPTLAPLGGGAAAGGGRGAEPHAPGGA